MAKQKLTELYTPYEDARGKLAGHAPGVIRVRKEIWRDGSRYVMNHWLPVPPVLRHLDGVTMRGLVLVALAVAVVLAAARWLLLGGRQ